MLHSFNYQIHIVSRQDKIALKRFYSDTKCQNEHLAPDLHY